MKRRLSVLALGAVLLAGLTACPGHPSDPSAVEVEDCDAEDRRNREAECGLLPGPAPTKAAPRKTKQAPKTGTTKRK